jgi:branched-chain amino acid transport system substrate-binding protein
MTDGQRNPFIFGNSLNLWQSAYALGYWASQQLGSRAGVAAALHEAGYGIVSAFWLGFCEAGGGTILGTEVTHRQTADDDPTEQVRRLADLSPDFIMAFYSGREGISFVNTYASLGLAGRLPLIASPLMSHGQGLPKMRNHIGGVRTAFSWDLNSRPEEHKRFRRIGKVKVGMEPAVFTLLGYETGLALHAAVAGRDEITGEQLQEALSGVAFMSPRGPLHLKAETGEVATVDYLQELQARDDGTCTAVTLGTLPLPPSFQRDWDAVKRSDARSGWINPYLVT